MTTNTITVQIVRDDSAAVAARVLAAAQRTVERAQEEAHAEVVERMTGPHSGTVYGPDVAFTTRGRRGMEGPFLVSFTTNRGSHQASAPNETSLASWSGEYLRLTAILPIVTSGARSVGRVVAGAPYARRFELGTSGTAPRPMWHDIASQMERRFKEIGREEMQKALKGR